MSCGRFAALQPSLARRRSFGNPLNCCKTPNRARRLSNPYSEQYCVKHSEGRMKEAVIVSTARTGLAKAWRGAFNMTYGATLGGHAVEHAVARAGIDPAEVEDVIMG